MTIIFVFWFLLKGSDKCVHRHVFFFFLQEASYLQSVKTLPTDIIKHESLLLTVCLSSIGIVAGNSHGKAQTVESATTKSHIYNALVSWFLSLVNDFFFCTIGCHFFCLRHHSLLMGGYVLCGRLDQALDVRTRLASKLHSGLQDFSSSGERMDWLFTS